VPANKPARAGSALVIAKWALRLRSSARLAQGPAFPLTPIRSTRQSILQGPPRRAALESRLVTGRAPSSLPWRQGASVNSASPYCHELAYRSLPSHRLSPSRPAGQLIYRADGTGFDPEGRHASRGFCRGEGRLAQGRMRRPTVRRKMWLAANEAHFNATGDADSGQSGPRRAPSAVSLRRETRSALAG